MEKQSLQVERHKKRSSSFPAHPNQAASAINRKRSELPQEGDPRLSKKHVLQWPGQHRADLDQMPEAVLWQLQPCKHTRYVCSCVIVCPDCVFLHFSFDTFSSRVHQPSRLQMIPQKVIMVMYCTVLYSLKHLWFFFTPESGLNCWAVRLHSFSSCNSAHGGCKKVLLVAVLGTSRQVFISLLHMQSEIVTLLFSQTPAPT